MPARTIPVDPFDLVVFGATGDFSTRKLPPALYRRFVVGQMPASARIIGVARMNLDTSAFQLAVRESRAAGPFGQSDRARSRTVQILSSQRWIC